MTLTLHDIDGQVLRLDAAEIELLGEMTIAGKEATRILLRSGGDLIVRELASSILPLVTDLQIASEFE